MFQALGLNITRGVVTTAAASYSREKVKEQVGKSTAWSNFYSAVVTGLGGAGVATLLETPYIRETLRKPTQPRSLFPFSYFSKQLTGFYFLRDFTFTYGVLGAAEMTPVARNAALLGATGVNAGMHKLITLEVGKDLIAAEGTVPNYRKGFGYVLKSLANGNVFTHPALKAPFQQPGSLLKKMANVMAVTCGPNVFMFRLAYTFIFSEALCYSANGVTALNERFGLFGAKEKKQLQNDKPVSEKENRAKP